MENLKVSCTRCNGTGMVEHSHVMDGICFLCNGFGTISKTKAKQDLAKIQAKKQAVEKRNIKMYEKAERAFIAKEKEYFEWQKKRNINFLKSFESNEIEKKKCSQVLGMLEYLINSDDIEVSKNFTSSSIEKFFKKEFFNYKNAILSCLLKKYGSDNVDVPNNIDLETNENKMHFFTNNLLK